MPDIRLRSVKDEVGFWGGIQRLTVDRKGVFRFIEAKDCRAASLDADILDIFDLPKVSYRGDHK